MAKLLLFFEPPAKGAVRGGISFASGQILCMIPDTVPPIKRIGGAINWTYKVH
jgi:hypothetical protein